MREIKFRAWDKNLEFMIDPGYLSLDGSGLQSVFYDNCDEGESGWESDVRDIVLMQYTGLKDKNGKEIYEGDILDVDTENRIVEVVWFEPQGCFDTNVVRVKDETWTYFKALQNSQWSYRCEVIGNIYENPELIKIS